MDGRRPLCRHEPRGVRVMQTESVSWMKRGECVGHDQDLWFANPTSYGAS